MSDEPDTTTEPEVESSTTCDVAIVGGGISGLYCAFKLMENPMQLDNLGIKKIIILEKSNRWGGRLDTDIVTIKGSDGRETVIKEEEGAMRFTYNEDPSKSNMPLLGSLIKDLGMEGDVVPFYMEPQKKQTCLRPKSDLADRGESAVPNCNARYFRGRHFTEWYATQNPTLWKNIFELEGKEEFKSAGEIVKDIYKKLLDHNKPELQQKYPTKFQVLIDQDNTDPRLQMYEDAEYWAFFRNKFTWTVGKQEIRLNDFTMQALMTEMGYSYGCLKMMMQTQGFQFVSLSKGNVGSTLQELITFNLIWNKLFQFKRGWSSMTQKLIDHLKVNSSKTRVSLEFKTNSMVFKVEDDNNEGFNLSIEETQTRAAISLSAKHVFISVPPKSLEKIFEKTQYWSMIKDTAIMDICRSVEGVHLTKINFYFKTDWWNQVENTCMFGPNFTSLPCGSVYPFYSECMAVGCPGCNKCDEDPCPAALTIYCDVNNAQFWSSLQRIGHKFQSPLQLQNQSKLLAASEAVVQEAIKLFKKVFNIEDVPHPVLTSYRSWDGQYERKTNDEDPKPSEYGYAIHEWGLGTDDNIMREKVAQPPEWKSLHICNEAWSEYQGWVEGSLMSTQSAVKKLLEQSQ